MKRNDGLGVEHGAVDLDAEWTHTGVFSDWYYRGIRPQDLPDWEIYRPKYEKWLRNGGLINDKGELIKSN